MTERLLCQDRQYIRPRLDPKEYKRIIYDPGRVTRIIMNRPRFLNTTSHAHLAELDDAFDRAACDENCHVIVLSGAGRCFCSGDDNIGLTPESAPTLWDGDARPPEKLIEEYGSENAVWDQYNIEHDYFIGYPFIHKLRTIPKPTIAMVHGYCIFMGYMMANAMDLIFASEDALFLSGGGGGGGGGLFRMGVRKSLELAYEHRFLPAKECHELGVVNRVFPDFETLEKETLAFAYRVAYESPIALRHAKESMINTLDILGFNAAAQIGRTPYAQTWRNDAIQGHRMRYEGKGRARTPVALANLAAKLQSEGEEVPKNVESAISRAIERDDKAAWQKATHQEWRAGDRLDRTEASAKAYEEMRVADEKLLKAEMKRRGLSYEEMQPAYERMILQAKTGK